MNKLPQLIENMTYSDLLALQKDLRVGNLDRLISKRMEDIKPTQTKCCPVCNISVSQDTHLTLIFGPADFRQKASFDGPDCLIYFLDQIRKKEEKETTTILGNKPPI
jgi:hypothetical protein